MRLALANGGAAGVVVVDFFDDDDDDEDDGDDGDRDGVRTEASVFSVRDGFCVLKSFAAR